MGVIRARREGWYGLGQIRTFTRAAVLSGTVQLRSVQTGRVLIVYGLGQI